jgi:hypothetical protein
MQPPCRVGGRGGRLTWAGPPFRSGLYHQRRPRRPDYREAAAIPTATANRTGMASSTVTAL